MAYFRLWGSDSDPFFSYKFRFCDRPGCIEMTLCSLATVIVAKRLISYTDPDVVPASTDLIFRCRLLSDDEFLTSLRPLIHDEIVIRCRSTSILPRATPTGEVLLPLEEPNPEYVSVLTDIGFQKDDVEFALQLMDNHFDPTMELLQMSTHEELIFLRISRIFFLKHPDLFWMMTPSNIDLPVYLSDFLWFFKLNPDFFDCDAITQQAQDEQMTDMFAPASPKMLALAREILEMDLNMSFESWANLLQGFPFRIRELVRLGFT
jgi:hypothetical protein